MTRKEEAKRVAEVAANAGDWTLETKRAFERKLENMSARDFKFWNSVAEVALRPSFAEYKARYGKLAERKQTPSFRAYKAGFGVS